jgi:DNA repair exonuclease SbcCD ATPase subunit
MDQNANKFQPPEEQMSQEEFDEVLVLRKEEARTPVPSEEVSFEKLASQLKQLRARKRAMENQLEHLDQDIDTIEIKLASLKAKEVSEFGDDAIKRLMALSTELAEWKLKKEAAAAEEKDAKRRMHELSLKMHELQPLEMPSFKYDGHLFIRKLVSYPRIEDP